MSLQMAKDFRISTNKELLDFETIFHFLNQESYWAKGITREIVQKSIDNSALCFGIYKVSPEEVSVQVGFARVITDLASFAYLCDVFVIPSYRGIGLSKCLMDTITSHPELQGVRRIMLATADAHSLYAQYGFEPLEAPDRFMQIMRKNIYQS